jgi:hypothetical protein
MRDALSESTGMTTAVNPTISSRVRRRGPGTRAFAWVARRRGLAVAVVGVLAFIASVALALATGIPQPRVHDEFSYLLAADTFAHGRLTNPPHPLWEHFETPYVLQQPTYASKYPPAQGLILALGQVLFGHPILGVWLSIALACAAICWMLQGWLSPRWAFFGGLLAVIQLVGFGRAYGGGTVGYWSQSYWGGAVAAFGGALTFGALPRLVHGLRVRDALLLGLGLVVMANSRPFEGLVASLPAAILLLGWVLGKRRPPLAVTLGRLLLPITLVLLPAAAGMAYYNFRVTGDPLRMPFQAYQDTYDVTPKFLVLAPKPEPAYRHTVMHDLHAGRDVAMYAEQTTLSGLFMMSLVKCIQLWSFFLGPLLTIPLFALRGLTRSPWTVFALATCGLSLAALLTETWVYPHYAAPITGLVFLLIVQGCRRLRLWRWPRKRGLSLYPQRDSPLFRGRTLVLAIPTLMLVWLAVSLFVGARADAASWPPHRGRLVADPRLPGERHLIIVRYGPGHSPFDEWVYNEADIDHAETVWAREMDTQHNRRLLAYFKDRRVWLLDADARPVTLVPYPLENDNCRGGGEQNADER